MTKYLVNLIYDPDYAGYVADVPSLAGCMTQGKTVEEALANVKDAIETYLGGLQEGDLPEPQLVLSTTVEV